MAQETKNSGTALFPPELVTDLVNKTKGRSSLAALCASRPIPFNGAQDFTFTMDKEIDVVAESGKKSKGGFTIAPRVIKPIKVEYSARVSDEFKYASESVRLDYLTAFNEGFAAKLARGIDIMAFHGLNPRTNTAATQVIGDNNFAKAITQKVEFDTAAEPAAEPAANPDTAIEDAIALVQGSENDVTGMVMAPSFRARLAKLTDTQGRRLFPELGWGNTPGAINGLPVQSNPTLAVNESKILALVGDFARAFRWGYARDVSLEVIEYGNPDNDETAGDLKGCNQVLLRSEAFLGWAILDPASFARVDEKAGD